MDPNVKPDQLPSVPPTVHVGGGVESAPISTEAPKIEFATHKNVELSPEVVQAGVVVNTAPNINPRVFTDNPEPAVELTQDPIALAEQIRVEEKALKADPKQSINWLRRLHIAVMEKLRVRQLEVKPT